MKIFVSYRRNDSRSMTERICDRLADFHGREAIFKDVDSVRLSTDFRESLTNVLRDSDVVLVVIGNQWLGSTEDGRRRIDDPGDFVRLEVEQALEEGITIAPVLVDDATMPRVDELPESLRRLTYFHATRVRCDPDFRHDFDRLAVFLAEHVIDKLIQAMIAGTRQPPLLSFEDNPMVQDCSEAISTDPFNTRPLLWRASLGRGYSASLGGTAEGFQCAIADYRKIREIDSNLADAYFGLADLYYMAAVFDLVKRRRYAVVKKGRFGSDFRTGLADIDYPVLQPLPDKHSRAVFSAALSQLELGLGLRQTTSTTAGGVMVVHAPDVGSLLRSIRAVLELEPAPASDDTFAGCVATLVMKYDYDAMTQIFSLEHLTKSG